MEPPDIALSRHPHDRIADRRVDDAWLEERWADPATRVLVVAGTRVRPVDGRRRSGSRRPKRPDGLRVLLGERDGVDHFAVVVDPAAAPGDARRVGRRCAARCRTLADATWPTQPLVLHAIGIAEWHWATRHCPRCGGAARAAAGRARAALHDVRPRPVPAHRPGRDHGRHRRRAGAEDERCLLGRQAAWPAGSLLDAGRLRRAGGDDRGRRTPRGAGGGRRPGRRGRLLRQPALAAPGQPDARVRRARRRRPRSRSTATEIEDARWFTRAEMQAEAEAGTLVLPGGVSISRSLVECWYGGPLPGSW